MFFWAFVSGLLNGALIWIKWKLREIEMRLEEQYGYGR